jgi:tetratricopeptide (TPR) repeat protein
MELTMPPRFEVMGRDGLFAPSNEIEEATSLFDALMEQRDAGRLQPAVYVKRLAALVERHPDFIDGHAHLGYAFFDQGRIEDGLAACQGGVAIGDAVIPKSFKGVISWSFLENRPYLRALHVVVLCQMKRGEGASAIAVMERMLRLNPDDNQGIRLLIGSAFLRSGERNKARKALEAEADGYPPCRYDLALLNWIEGDAVKAATELRRGFVENVYIAEILCGNPDPAPLPIWHGINYAEVDFAKDYIADHGPLWRETKGAVPFLRWLFTCSAVLMERGALLACREELTFADDPMQRRASLDRQAELVARIDDASSKALIAPRKDRHGKLIEPWAFRR